MNSSLLRMVAGYSRFALQEERKHNRVISACLQPSAYKKFYLNQQIIQGIIHPPQIPNTLQKLNFINSLHDNQIFSEKKLTFIEQKSQNIENKINALQYQANNGIEDRLVVDTLPSLGAETVSVFDGHGGDKLSDYCANQVVDVLDGFLQKNKLDQKYVNNIDGLITDSLISTYQKLDKDFYQNIFKPLMAHNNKKIRGVGTCALTVIVHDKKIYVANAGDSQAIAVLRGKNGQVKYIDLNQRFSVNNPAQRQRIKKQFPNDDDIIVQERNGCYYLKGRLQPTRALGDYHLKYSNLFKGKGQFNGPYIRNVPDVKIIQINQDFQSIVVASDGVWDFAKKEDIAQLSLQQNPHQKILQKTLNNVAQLHKKSVSQIRQMQISQKRSFHDDISIAVIELGRKSRKISIL